MQPVEKRSANAMQQFIDAHVCFLFQLNIVAGSHNKTIGTVKPCESFIDRLVC